MFDEGKLVILHQPTTMGLNGAMKSSTPRHPINYASRLSGVSTHAIRIWERRYGAVNPTRSSARQRLYSDDDIQRLTLLKRGTDAGHAISKLAEMTDNDIREILRDASRPEIEGAKRTALDTKLTGRLEELVSGCCKAVEELDSAKLVRLFAVAHNELPLETMLDHVVSPLMHWVGNAWHDGRLSVAHEHMASAALRAFLDSIHGSVRVNPDGPGIVVTTPASQRHEIGAILVAISAAAEGWRDHYFGADMPA